MTSSIRLNEFTTEYDARDLFYRDDSDEVPGRRGDDAGAILFRHSVDGHAADLVALDRGQTSPLELLDAAIAALSAARDEYAAMVPAERRQPGQCVTFGDWGRCKLRTGHEVDCDHIFRTEEEWTAEQEALGKRYPRSA